MLKKTSSILSQDFFFPAIEALKKGKLIAFETDTVPGLAVDAFNKNAVQALYDLKGRDRSKKLVWMSDKWSKVSRYLSYDKRSYELSKQLWPGPVTIVWKQRTSQQKSVANKKKSVANTNNSHLLGNNDVSFEKQAVRLPKDDYLLNFFAHYPWPLAVTSANESGKKEAKSLEEVKNIFGDQIAFYLQHKVESSGVSSLVIDVSEGQLKLLRGGEKKVTEKIMKAAKKLGYPIADGQDF